MSSRYTKTITTLLSLGNGKANCNFDTQKINEILTPETGGILQVVGVLWGVERRRWSGGTENIRHL